jgi:hypothetical protein
MNWWQALLLGGAIGLVIMPLFVFIAKKLGMFFLKIRLKRLIKQGKFLQPIDAKDFDVEKWKDVIKLDPTDLDKVNSNIFKNG